MNITLMTFGSRGDVQPFLALAIALRERGHGVRLAAPTDFEVQANAYDIPYTRIPLDVREMSERFASRQAADRGVNPALLIAAWREIIPEMKRAFFSAAFTYAEAARASDLIISHGFLVPLAYSIHQHLQIPLMLGIAGPIATTRMFPSPMFPSAPFGQRFYNPLTFKFLVRGITAYMIAPVNNYRQQIGLPKLSASRMNSILLDAQVPVLMHYSQHLGPVAPDWNTNAHVVGTWNLPAPDDWTPPEALSAFLAAGEPSVFFGFGSMKVSNPGHTAQVISEALRRTNLRGVLQSGWAGLAYEDDHLITVDDTPHEWLFPQVTAIVHHGGSGTTHSAASAGKPALIVPFMADQPFWGRRLVELGIGVSPIKPNKLTTENLSAALRTLTQDSAMRQRAAELGALIRAEDGLAATCELVEKYAT